MYIGDSLVTRNPEVTKPHIGVSGASVRVRTDNYGAAGVLGVGVTHHRQDPAGIGDEVGQVAVTVAQRLQRFAQRSEKQKDDRPLKHEFASKTSACDSGENAQTRENRKRREVGDQSAFADLNRKAGQLWPMQQTSQANPICQPDGRSVTSKETRVRWHVLRWHI